MLPKSRNADAIAKLSLVGGRICLDFTNTVSLRDSDLSRDHLESYGDLLHWSVRAGIITEGQAHVLAAGAGRDPEGAARVFQQAIELREVIFRMFSPRAEEQEPADEDLAVFNRHFSGAMSHACIIRQSGRYTVGFEGSRELDCMLPPLAWSAAELLRDPAAALVKECAGETCGWLFVDSSKNHSRRWCEMRDCGNRAKAHRHYQRLKHRGRKGMRAAIRPRGA